MLPNLRKRGRAASDPVFAALDLGTNNCRLLVARPVMGADKSFASLKVLDSFSRIVRLGEGVSQSGELSPEAMSRTIAALKVCKKKLDRQQVTHAHFVATEACRQAKNRDAFMKAVHDEVGFDITIITAEEEAQLAFMGCATLLKSEPPNALVFDIGGGSTEFMWVAWPAGRKLDPLTPPPITDWYSLPSGVMNLSETFGGGTFAEVYFDEMVDKLAARLHEFDVKNGISKAITAGQVQMLSTSGTVTTLAAIHLGLPRYERARIDGITLPTGSLCEATRAILHMRSSERFSHPCIGPDRSDYIISGCAIFEAICKLWPMGHITIADRGVREGIIISLIKQSMQS